MLKVEISQNRGKKINKQRGKEGNSFSSFLVGTAIFFLQLTGIFQHLKNIKIARIHKSGKGKRKRSAKVKEVQHLQCNSNCTCNSGPGINPLNQSLKRFRFTRTSNNTTPPYNCTATLSFGDTSNTL